MSVDACAGTGFVLAADLPLTDEEDEPDEERLLFFVTGRSAPFTQRVVGYRLQAVQMRPLRRQCRRPEASDWWRSACGFVSCASLEVPKPWNIASKTAKKGSTVIQPYICGLK